MQAPRFVLVLSAQSNLLRASLVTRELRNVASAKQTFNVTRVSDGAPEFDPAQVWYLMKKVIAACFDIGRTLSREIVGVVVVGETNTRVVWSQQANEVMSRGTIELSDGATAQPGLNEVLQDDGTDAGTMAAWLVWNLTGGLSSEDDQGLGKTRSRAPFDAELPLLMLLEEAAGQGAGGRDDTLHAAGLGWQKVEAEKQPELRANGD